jgi:hypothetical protein
MQNLGFSQLFLKHKRIKDPWLVMPQKSQCLSLRLLILFLISSFKAHAEAKARMRISSLAHLNFSIVFFFMTTTPYPLILQRKENRNEKSS